MIIAAAVSLALALNPPIRPRKRKQHTAVRRVVPKKPSAPTMLLALRAELLHDFLVRAGTESPSFEDARIISDPSGIRIGPTSIDADFLGAPIVRAVVRNESNRSIDVLVSASVRDARGRRVQASTWIERLEPGSSRTAEIFCPAPIEPASVEWTVTPL
jgi:hypothetical protein